MSVRLLLEARAELQVTFPETMWGCPQGDVAKGHRLVVFIQDSCPSWERVAQGQRLSCAVRLSASPSQV